jgi:hypothetical protein
MLGVGGDVEDHEVAELQGSGILETIEDVARPADEPQVDVLRRSPAGAPRALA